MTTSSPFTCDICHEDYFSDIEEEICVIPCGHVYHKNCLDRWFHTQHQQNHPGTCPICRKPANSRQAIRIFGSGSSAANPDIRADVLTCTDYLRNNYSWKLFAQRRPDLKHSLGLICNFSSSGTRFWNEFQWLHVFNASTRLLAEMVLHMVVGVIAILPVVLFMLIVMSMKIILDLIEKFENGNEIGENEKMH